MGISNYIAFLDSAAHPKYTYVKQETFKIPSNYELPNRKNFINWFDSFYNDYKAKKTFTQSNTKTDRLDFFTHQKLVKDYMHSGNPYKGLLLYHGLGVGKTCAAIAMVYVIDDVR